MKVSPILKVCVRIRTHVITALVVCEKHSKLLWKTVDMAKPSTIAEGKRNSNNDNYIYIIFW